MTAYRFAPRPSLALALAAGLMVACVMSPAGADDEQPVTAAERSSLSLTVYNADLALVRDVRNVPLDAGRNRIAFEDVTRELRPETAVLKPAGGSDFSVAEQDFEFDELTPAKLLQRSVGKPVMVIRTNPATGAETVEDATVLAAGNGVVLKIGDRIETGIPGRIAFGSVPRALRARPTLLALVESANAQTVPAVLSYLTGGLSWHADYVAELDEAERHLDLRVWATLTNTSGLDFSGARLRLVAGDVQTLGRRPPVPVMRTEAAVGARAAPGMAQEKIADLHLYEVHRPLDIADRQTKQLALLSAERVPVSKEYRVEGYTPPAPERTEPEHPPVRVRLSFENDANAGLGVPLPRGILRIYERRDGGDAVFLGEDEVGDTPKGEIVRLDTGRAFDVTAERRQIGFSRRDLPKNTFEVAYETVLRNAGRSPVQVNVIETLPGDWQILSESQSHVKASSSRAEWTVAVPARGRSTLTWRARVTR